MLLCYYERTYIKIRIYEAYHLIPPTTISLPINTTSVTHNTTIAPPNTIIVQNIYRNLRGHG